MTDKPRDVSAPSNDAKAKFREALERKKSASQKHNDSQRSTTGGVQGTTSSGPTQRMFRRKAGG